MKTRAHSSIEIQDEQTFNQTHQQKGRGLK